MIEIAMSASFKRAYRRRISGNKSQEQKFLQKLKIFQASPFERQLRTHKLSRNLSELWSFSIEYDLRVVFYFEEENRVVLVDIGSHDEVY